MTEQDLQKRLGDVPPVPDSLFPQVSNRIIRDRRMRVFSWAAAAALVLALGTGTYLGTSSNGPSLTAETQSEELAEELYDICGFLNGNTVDDELEAHAVVNAGLF